MLVPTVCSDANPRVRFAGLNLLAQIAVDYAVRAPGRRACDRARAGCLHPLQPAFQKRYHAAGFQMVTEGLNLASGINPRHAQAVAGRVPAQRPRAELFANRVWPLWTCCTKCRRRSSGPTCQASCSASPLC
jgi:hypothetical protein